MADHSINRLATSLGTPLSFQREESQWMQIAMKEFKKNLGHKDIFSGKVNLEQGKSILRFHSSTLERALAQRQPQRASILDPKGFLQSGLHLVFRYTIWYCHFETNLRCIKRLLWCAYQTTRKMQFLLCFSQKIMLFMNAVFLRILSWLCASQIL